MSRKKNPAHNHEAGRRRRIMRHHWQCRKALRIYFDVSPLELPDSSFFKLLNDHIRDDFDGGTFTVPVPKPH